MKSFLRHGATFQHRMFDMAVTVRVEKVAGLWCQIRCFGTNSEEIALAVAQALPQAAPSAVVIALGPEASVVAATTAALAGFFGSACPVLGGVTLDNLECSSDLAETGMRVAVLLLEASWCRVGIGVAELKNGPIACGQRAVESAIAALGTSVANIGPNHVALTLLDGSSGYAESFCLGTATVASGLKVVGGALGSRDYAQGTRPAIWIGTQQLDCLGLVILLESKRKLVSIESIHVEPSDRRTIVTGCSGNHIIELDGMPASSRYLELLNGIAEHQVLPDTPTLYPFGWYSRGRPYLRSVLRIHEDYLIMAGTVTRGQVLRLMKPNDIVAATHRDMVAADTLLGGCVGWLAFSCLEREFEARLSSVLPSLRAEYFALPCFGFESLGEQSGMMWVNHTLTGLAIGALQ